VRIRCILSGNGLQFIVDVVVLACAAILRGARHHALQRQGFRFETRLVGRDEVERDGVFVGTIRNQKLYGAWFQGAKLHYFHRYLPEFDRMVTSAQLVGEAAR